jgi:DNA-binding GntR family transcriptional regulator
MKFAPQFEQRNLPDQLADHIVILIATGGMLPAQRLVEKELCESLGVSRIPLREALRILQAQGVIRTVPNRGSFVTEFGSTETAEMLQVRLSVERMAFRRVMKRVAQNPSILRELRAKVEGLRQAARTLDQLTYCQADLAFHQCVVGLSESPLLKPIWNSLARGVLFFLMQERQVRFDYRESISEHNLLVELISRGDPAAMEEEIERHILTKVSDSTLRAEKTSTKNASGKRGARMQRKPA